MYTTMPPSAQIQMRARAPFAGTVDSHRHSGHAPMAANGVSTCERDGREHLYASTTKPEGVSGRIRTQCNGFLVAKEAPHHGHRLGLQLGKYTLWYKGGKGEPAYGPGADIAVIVLNSSVYLSPSRVT
ncbi:hypothetical protein M409DRAFT_57654 [Zasmidium cellare ATCC 36951]|uniref:Uncharacterized protein n=1 Tax=Zasmidium cellare ATCC 36951 TaxID=1080233 RepID=A0A6A6CD58_ZASCE|nr:uncharacterized protein M409DRAFT_57654 [Zasmidium cellare ATCC 36951]KAF2163376.1 hypothetical protein M409DRAFT_57654 [Zasmidium cellare ATCC 36951]